MFRTLDCSKVIIFNLDLKVSPGFECEIVFYLAVRRSQFNSIRRRFGIHVDSFFWSIQECVWAFLNRPEKNINMDTETSSSSINLTPANRQRNTIL
jgi:hypothetical protein